MSIELTSEQIELKDKCVEFYRHFGKNKPYFYYSGAAGTGKTTVMRYIMDSLRIKEDEFIACAYTGKAVLNLLRHGLNASTIHSLIYRPEFKTVRETVIDEFGNPKEYKKKKMTFVLKSELPKKLKLIVVDEIGMVNDQMIQDILSFGIPVIMMGDMHQLPPVFGISSILDYPDFVLTKIMRQEENNPIVYLSQCILKGIPLEYGTYKTSRVVPSVQIDRKILEDYNIVLCGKNKTREMLNDTIRNDVLGYPDRKPMLFDKVICRRNNWDECINGIYLTNGLSGIITDVNYCSLYRNILYMDFKPDFMDDSFDHLTVDYRFLTDDWKSKKDVPFDMEKERFEYAYAITVHLSQGSEYPSVLYMDETFHDPETLKRLQYTAVTRAVDRITYVKSEQRKLYQYNYNGYNYNISA